MYLTSNLTGPLPPSPTQPFTGIGTALPQPGAAYPFQYTLYLVVFFLLLFVSVLRKLWNVYRPRSPPPAENPTNTIAVELDDMESLAEVVIDDDTSQQLELPRAGRVVIHRAATVPLEQATPSSPPLLHTTTAQTIEIDVAPRRSTFPIRRQHRLNAHITFDDGGGNSRLADILDVVNGNGESDTGWDDYDFFIGDLSPV